MRSRRGDVARMRALAVAAVLVAAAGCAGSPEGVARDDLPRVVLQPADLPRDYERFDEGRLIRADEPRGEAGWKARYRRRDSSEGALVVVSRVDLFDDADAARRAFDDVVSELRAAAATGGVAEAELGDEAVVATLRQESAVRPVTFVYVAWREENATASLTVNGFAGRVTAEDGLALARKQQQRLERAIG